MPSTMRLLAIDPGLVCTGVAWFDGGRLCRIGGAQSSAHDPLTTRARSLVDQIVDTFPPTIYEGAITIELPTIYPYGRGKGGGNDIRDLAVLVGALLESFRGPCDLVPPAAWKGQVPKEIHQERILAKLDAREREIVEHAREKYGAKTHNLIDAIGLGLYSIGRAA